MLAAGYGTRGARHTRRESGARLPSRLALRGAGFKRKLMKGGGVGHGCKVREGHYHLRGNRIGAHAVHVALSADHPRRNRTRFHRGGGGGRVGAPSPCARPKGPPPDARPGRLHAVPAAHQAKTAMRS
jgi:hypothetical protein